MHEFVLKAQIANDQRTALHLAGARLAMWRVRHCVRNSPTRALRSAAGRPARCAPKVRLLEHERIDWRTERTSKLDWRSAKEELVDTILRTILRELFEVQNLA